MIKPVGRDVDITGKKYGMLTIIRRAEDKTKWICQCDCREEAEEKYFKEYSYRNSILKGAEQIC